MWDPGWKELGCGGMWEALKDLSRWGGTAGFERELGTAWREGQREGSTTVEYKGD